MDWRYQVTGQWPLMFVVMMLIVLRTGGAYFLHD